MEKPNLDQEITNLQNEANKLHSLIMGEGKGITTPLKRKRQNQQADILTKINILTDKRDLQRETEALKKINKLFKTSTRLIVLTTNGNRITPNEDLEITLNFTCGKHTKKIHISELLTCQKVAISKQTLLAKWNGLLNSNTTLSTKVNCQQCRDTKSKKLTMFRRYSPTDTIGTCSVTLQII